LKVLVQNPATGKILVRRWTKGELMKSIAWLKRMNARGNDILVQPDEAHGLVLVGGLSKERLSAMNRDGFEPTITVQVRPGVFPAWVRLANQHVADRSLGIAAAGLAKRYEGTADTIGHLAGFTLHRNGPGSSAPAPFALVHELSTGRASLGPEYLRKIELALGEERQRAERSSRSRDRSR
jgi:hypothetical protein